MSTSTWSAPVRFVEVDGQQVVFNAHYLTWCDEAMSAHFAGLDVPGRDLAEFSIRVRVVSATLTWTSSAVWNDVVSVDVDCTRVGRTSLALRFAVRVGERGCCVVDIVYVHVDAEGRPAAVPGDVRAALTAPE